MKIDVYIHLQDESRIDEILAAIDVLEAKMSKELDNLAAAVQRNTDVEDSAITLIQGLAEQLLAAKDDPVKIQALANDILAKADSLASAVTANTPTP